MKILGIILILVFFALMFLLLISIECYFFFLGIILILVFFALMSLLLISTNNTLECYFFYHKEWVLWEKVIKNFDKKIFNFKYDTGDVSYYIKIDNVVFTMYRWVDGPVSLHDNNEFCLSPYDEYHQKKLKKLFEKELSK